LKSYVKSSLWTVPLVAAAVDAVVKPLTENEERTDDQEGILDPRTCFRGLSMTESRRVPCVRTSAEQSNRPREGRT
jgi:hypothetical protein